MSGKAQKINSVIFQLVYFRVSPAAKNLYANTRQKLKNDFLLKQLEMPHGVSIGLKRQNFF